MASKLRSSAAATLEPAEDADAVPVITIPAATAVAEPALARVLGLLERWSVPILALLLLVIAPLCLDSFRLPLAGKYLSYAFCAVGVVMVWGYGGILSLGQGIFFGMGGYAMAMFLKLEATANADATSGNALAAFYGSNLPDFMVWNSVETLPWFWEPFKFIAPTIAVILLLPPLVAFVLAYLSFRKRVGGVYFSIITLSLASILSIVIIGQQGYTGGVNGITDFKTFLGWDLDPPSSKVVLYFVAAVLLIGVVIAARFIARGRLGRVLVAIRDREDRVRFSGYNPALFKAFIFAFAALVSALGGAMFSLQVGFASPSLIGITPSIEMVIYAMVGGRISIVGAVYGTLLVFSAKTFFSEDFPQLWLFLIGALFIGLTVFLPQGLAGLVTTLRQKAAAR